MIHVALEKEHGGPAGGGKQGGQSDTISRKNQVLFRDYG